MSVSAYELAGNRIRFQVEFKNDAGVLTNPTAVTCIVGLAGADGDSLSVVQDSTGVYHADWDTTSVGAGTYWARFNGTGTLVAAAEMKVKVCGSRLTN